MTSTPLPVLTHSDNISHAPLPTPVQMSPGPTLTATPVQTLPSYDTTIDLHQHQHLFQDLI
jgi:hypothetical protein